MNMKGTKTWHYKSFADRIFDQKLKSSLIISFWKNSVLFDSGCSPAWSCHHCSVHWRRIRRQSPMSPNSATVAEIGDYSRQCGQGISRRFRRSVVGSPMNSAVRHRWSSPISGVTLSQMTTTDYTPPGSCFQESFSCSWHLPGLASSVACKTSELIHSNREQNVPESPVCKWAFSVLISVELLI